MPGKLDGAEEEIRRLLLENPDITVAAMALLFECGATTLSKALKKFGLRTKHWGERKHTEETKRKFSARMQALDMTGANNPNFGIRARPWLEGENHPFRKWHQQNPGFGERQKGAANPVHTVQHLYTDPTYVMHITRGLRAHTQEKTGKSYEEVYGEEKAGTYREKLRLASPERLRKTRRKETGIERIVANLLLEMGLQHQREVGFGPWTVDFVLPDLQLVIQADGDYWHAHPDSFPTEKLTKQQRDRRRLDKACDSYFTNRGYGVLRFWERDIHKNLMMCKERILGYIDARKARVEADNV